MSLSSVTPVLPPNIHASILTRAGLASIRDAVPTDAEAFVAYWHCSEHSFGEQELLLGTRYGAWSKAIADEAYARGLLFDRVYCENPDDGRNIAAKLGKDSV